ncbi:hypothetical protein [Methylocella sp.]|uniref:hypothetical protein n=1 Tax=Methylocella sp. TaxID=1978226 RepID=UPI003784AD46
MDTSLERIRAKIAEFEQKIEDLRAAERVLAELDATPAKRGRKPSVAAPALPDSSAAPPAPRTRGRRKGASRGGPRQTIGSAIGDVLEAQGPLTAAEISEHLKSSGRDITNRMVSFALQAMKKRGLAKNADGKWSSLKPRAK